MALCALMYFNVAASLASNMRFVVLDVTAPSSRGERNIHSCLSWNVMVIVQFELPLAGT